MVIFINILSDLKEYPEDATEIRELIERRRHYLNVVSATAILAVSNLLIEVEQQLFYRHSNGVQLSDGIFTYRKLMLTWLIVWCIFHL